MIKSILQSIITAQIFVLLASPAFCGVWSDLRDDVERNAKLTVLEAVTPIYIYEVGDSGNKQKAGLSTSIITYRIISIDCGWSHSIETQSGIGEAILGGSLHFNKMLENYAPDLLAYLEERIPESTIALIKKCRLGFYTGHSFESNRFTYGFYSGVELKF